MVHLKFIQVTVYGENTLNLSTQDYQWGMAVKKGKVEKGILVRVLAHRIPFLHLLAKPAMPTQTTVEPHLNVTSLLWHFFRVVKISQQPAHFTGYFEYCTGYSEC